MVQECSLFSPRKEQFSASKQSFGVGGGGKGLFVNYCNLLSKDITYT